MCIRDSFTKDLGLQAIFMHLLGDAANDVGVIIAAAIMQWSKSKNRFYADPAISMIISIGIACTAIPLGEKR